MKRTLTDYAKRLVPHGIRVFLRKVNWRRLYLQQTIIGAKHSPVYCPIAERQFKAFVRVSGDLITPSNGAKRRHRLIWLFLKHETALFDERVELLHIAPELCYFEVLTRCPNIVYTPGDKMVTGYSNQRGIQYMDLLSLSTPADTFDYVLCNHVLEHIPDDVQAMREIHRVLKAGGVAVITVPIDISLMRTYEDFSITDPASRERHFGQWDHVRWYGLDIRERLEKVGFTVEMHEYGKEFDQKAYTRFGLCDDIIVVAKKP